METATENIRQKSTELGFSKCGFAKAEALEEERSVFLNYLEEKRNAGIHYLEWDPEKRIDPRLVMEEARSVIGLLMNYYPVKIIPEEDNFIIAKYAYGKDYHHVMKGKMKKLAQFLKEELGAKSVRTYVDSAPLLEKKWAQQCGLGWIGKNTLLINKSSGSFFVIGILLTDLVLDYDTPEKDHCGSCEKCLKVCPTGALLEPCKLDPRLCISYHTLENKWELPFDLKDRFNDRIYGCDICQDVCPFNSFAKPATEREFSPHPSLFRMRKEDWINLDEDTFRELFKGTPVDHIGYDQLKRNIRFVSNRS